MKIERIETHVCHARMRNWVFVKVLTNEPGLFGWGEGTLEWHTRSVVGAVEDLADLLIGEDPSRIEHLWQLMYTIAWWQQAVLMILSLRASTVAHVFQHLLSDTHTT